VNATQVGHLIGALDTGLLTAPNSILAPRRQRTVGFGSALQTGHSGLALPVWPRNLNATVRVKPVTVLQWHRKGLPAQLAVPIKITLRGSAEMPVHTRAIRRHVFVCQPFFPRPPI
jgi:hypothetical protein